MADGGEGTAETIRAAVRGRRVVCRVRDPLGRPIRAAYALVDCSRTAVIETAAASGLALLAPRERDPLRATTFGTGELIRDALDRGVRAILLGLGGSATNDAGTGLARALGARFLDRHGRELPAGGAALARLARIDVARLDPRLRRVSFTAACDVRNPLTGPNGASAVYGPQKGATPGDVRRLDRALARFARVAARDLGRRVDRRPGAGAAGGLGAGLMAFLDAKIVPGVERVAACVELDRHLRGCDLVITGEGRLDAQSLQGKVPVGVARLAAARGIPAIALGGALGPGAERLCRRGPLAAIFAAGAPADPSRLAREAAPRLRNLSEQVGRLLALACGPARRVPHRVLGQWRGGSA
jgi:glycerate kinase